jgi:predicted HTH domain antitoxin
MTTLHIDLEEELIALLRQSDQSAPHAARELIVLELYRRGTLSSGKAAQLLQMPREQFLSHASRLGIPYLDMTSDEWDAEKSRSQRL